MQNAICKDIFSIESNGVVLSCCEAEHHYEPILGNIKDMSIDDILNSDEYKKFTNNREPYCITCTQRHNLQLNFTKKGTKVNRR